MNSISYIKKSFDISENSKNDNSEKIKTKAIDLKRNHRQVY